MVSSSVRIPVAGLSGFYGRQPVESPSDVSRVGLFKAFCEAVFLAIPIGLSVVVLCDDSDDNEEEPKAIKKAEKETIKEPEENS